MDDSWDGPYEVFRKLNDVNYEVIIPKHRGRRKVVHVNNLKPPWVQEQARVLRIVVGADEAEDSHEGLKVSGATIVAQELEKRAEVRSDYTDVSREEPGELKGDEIEINTGDSPSIRSMLYRLCPARRAQVKDEIDQLLRGKIIEPGKGPWSSPIVPVRNQTVLSVYVWISAS